MTHGHPVNSNDWNNTFRRHTPEDKVPSFFLGLLLRVFSRYTTNNMTQNYDVIIVGGGPVGLFLGLKLALEDIRVLVIEQESDIPQSPRALM